MYLRDWHALIRKHFAAHEYEMFVPSHGWGERWMKQLAVRLDPQGSVWRAARLLGGALAAVCRKAGDAPVAGDPARFETLLRCPDCGGDLGRGDSDTLRCRQCGFEAANEGGVYTLLPSEERAELYPGDRDDVIDFSLPQHAARLLEGWYELEGVFGNKYRWIGPHASARLAPVRAGRQRLRIRGSAHEDAFAAGEPVRVKIAANAQPVARQTLDRAGVFIIEADLPEAPEYLIEIAATPTWVAPDDDRVFTVNFAMIRLVPAE